MVGHASGAAASFWLCPQPVSSASNASGTRPDRAHGEAYWDSMNESHDRFDVHFDGGPRWR